MSDICTLVSVARTLAMCVGPMVCTPDPMLDGARACRQGPAPQCNYDIETWSCRREDGSTYERRVERK